MNSKAISFILTVALTAATAHGAEPGYPPTAETLPPGFVSVFNGKDFSGWHGLATMDPRKFAALAPTSGPRCSPKATTT